MGITVSADGEMNRRKLSFFFAFLWHAQPAFDVTCTRHATVTNTFPEGRAESAAIGDWTSAQDRERHEIKTGARLE